MFNIMILSVVIMFETYALKPLLRTKQRMWFIQWYPISFITIFKTAFLFYHDGDNLLLNDTVPLCAAPFLQMPGCLENSKLALFYPKLRSHPKSFAWLTGWLFFQMTAIFISYASLLFHLIFCLTLFYLLILMMADFFSSSWHKWKKSLSGEVHSLVRSLQKY